MAKSGFFDGTIHAGTGIIPSFAYGCFTWFRKDYSLVDNTTTIEWTVSLSERGGAYDSQPYRKIAVSIDGLAEEYVTYSPAPGNGELRDLGTYSTTIKHELDGSKSCEVMVQIQTNAYKTEAEAAASEWSTGMYDTLTGTFTLDSFDRLPTLLSAPNFTDEENPVITYSNPLGEAIEGLEACIAGADNNVIVPYRAVSKTGSAYTFNLTIDERNRLRAAATGSTARVRFYLIYKIDGNWVYPYLERTMTLVDITPELNPICGEGDYDIAALTGDNQKIILGYSDIYYEVKATAPAGASLISQSIRCGGQTLTTAYGKFTNTNSNVVEFSVRDSRDNVASKTVELDVVPYIKPTCNQTVRLNPDGSAALIVKGNYFADSFGKVDNTLSVQNRWRESGGEWSDWNVLDVLISDISNNTYTLTATISGYDPSGTYEFQSRAIDKLTTAESGVDAVTLKPIFDWGKYDFNFNVPLTIEGNPLADYVIETGTEAMGSNGTWYWEKWKSGKAVCYGCRNYGNMSVSGVWGNLFVSPEFNQSLPSGLFKSTPESIQISVRDATFAGAFILNGGGELPNAAYTGAFNVVRSSAANLQQVYISFDIKGRWK